MEFTRIFNLHTIVLLVSISTYNLCYCQTTATQATTQTQSPTTTSVTATQATTTPTQSAATTTQAQPTTTSQATTTQTTTQTQTETTTTIQSTTTTQPTTTETTTTAEPFDPVLNLPPFTDECFQGKLNLEIEASRINWVNCNMFYFLKFKCKNCSFPESIRNFRKYLFTRFLDLNITKNKYS